ncbi:MAG: peroxiredoxin [Bacteroidales bacterium]|nr:peroxiredoxin [Bacteroidales bacterium]
MNIGDRIPEILGIDQDGNEIKSSDYRGRKIVLYSYPKANTSGCTAEACSLQAHKAELEAAGYAIIGVSKDKKELQKKFAEAQGLEFPLIADTETTLLQELGCWGEKVACGRRTIGILRTTYLVNEEGIIEKIFTPKEIKTKIHAEQILEALRSLNSEHLSLNNNM